MAAAKCPSAIPLSPASPCCHHIPAPSLPAPGSPLPPWKKPNYKKWFSNGLFPLQHFLAYHWEGEICARALGHLPSLETCPGCSGHWARELSAEPAAGAAAPRVGRAPPTGTAPPVPLGHGTAPWALQLSPGPFSLFHQTAGSQLRAVELALCLSRGLLPIRLNQEISSWTSGPKEAAIMYLLSACCFFAAGMTPWH